MSYHRRQVNNGARSRQHNDKMANMGETSSHDDKYNGGHGLRNFLIVLAVGGVTYFVVKKGLKMSPMGFLM